MSDEQRYYAKPGEIAPLALVDQWLGIWIQGSWQCYKVDHYEPIARSQQFTFDFGAVATQAWVAVTPVDTAAVLEQRQTPPEAMQIRFYPLDDIQVLFYIGSASSRFVTLRAQAQADLFTIQMDPCLHTTEVVILGNGNPFMNIFNPTGYNLLQSRVVFFGYRYQLNTKSVKTFHTGAEALHELGPVTLASSGGF